MAADEIYNIECFFCSKTFQSENDKVVFCSVDCETAFRDRHDTEYEDDPDEEPEL